MTGCVWIHLLLLLPLPHHSDSSMWHLGSYRVALGMDPYMLHMAEVCGYLGFPGGGGSLDGGLPS